MTREFVPEDMLKFTCLDPHIMAEEEGIDPIVSAKWHISQGPCATIEEGGAVQACGGIWIFWPGTAQAWVRFNLPCALSTLREVTRRMLSWADQYQLNRIQATTLTGWKEGEKFLASLGMKPEGIMRKYGPNGLDSTLYAWVR